MSTNDKLSADPGFLAQWSILGHDLDLDSGIAHQIGLELAARHSEPHRHYHTMAHIEAVLAHLADLQCTTVVARLAAFFHDVIYDPTQTDNEHRSADLARHMMGGVGDEIIDDVATIIVATASHQLGSGLPRETAAFLDADLAILGASPATYDTYTAHIRAEYCHVPPEEFNSRRAQVMQGFLERDRLYFTSAAQVRFEAAARNNLRREIDSLQAAGGWRGPLPAG